MGVEKKSTINRSNCTDERTVKQKKKVQRGVRARVPDHVQGTEEHKKKPTAEAAHSLRDAISLAQSVFTSDPDFCTQTHRHVSVCVILWGMFHLMRSRPWAAPDFLGTGLSKRNWATMG